MVSFLSVLILLAGKPTLVEILPGDVEHLLMVRPINNCAGLNLHHGSGVAL